MTQHSVLRYKKAIPDQVGNDMLKSGMTVQKKHPAARQGAF